MLTRTSARVAVSPWERPAASSRRRERTAARRHHRAGADEALHLVDRGARRVAIERQPRHVHRRRPAVGAEGELVDPLIGPARDDRLAGGVLLGRVVVATAGAALGVTARPGRGVDGEHERPDSVPERSTPIRRIGWPAAFTSWLPLTWTDTTGVAPAGGAPARSSSAHSVTARTARRTATGRRARQWRGRGRDNGDFLLCVRQRGGRPGACATGTALRPRALYHSWWSQERVLSPLAPGATERGGWPARTSRRSGNHKHGRAGLRTPRPGPPRGAGTPASKRRGTGGADGLVRRPPPLRDRTRCSAPDPPAATPCIQGGVGPAVAAATTSDGCPGANGQVEAQAPADDLHGHHERSGTRRSSPTESPPVPAGRPGGRGWSARPWQRRVRRRLHPRRRSTRGGEGRWQSEILPDSGERAGIIGAWPVLVGAGTTPRATRSCEEGVGAAGTGGSRGPETGTGDRARPGRGTMAGAWPDPRQDLCAPSMTTRPWP